MSTVLVDTRRPAVDAVFPPGDPVVVVLEWASGLTGRTFTASTLGGLSLDVDQLGDTVTVTATAGQAGLITGPADWLLFELIDGVARPVIQGVWAPDARAQSTTFATYDLTQGGDDVTVTVLTGGVAAAITAHAADLALHGGGVELFNTAKADAAFETRETAPDPVDGMSGTFIVPDRPFRLDFIAIGSAEDETTLCTVSLIDGDDELIWAEGWEPDLAGSTHSFAGAVRCPTPFWIPTPGDEVTVSLAGQVAAGTQQLQLLAGDLGGFGRYFMAMGGRTA